MQSKHRAASRIFLLIMMGFAHIQSSGSISSAFAVDSLYIQSNCESDSATVKNELYGESYVLIPMTINWYELCS